MKARFIVLPMLLSVLSIGHANATTRDVTTYGAVGNGTTDNYSAFTSALGACVSGDVLVVPAGTYKIILKQVNPVLVGKAGVTIEGVGSASIINLYAGDTLSNYHTFFTNGGNNVILSELVINRMQDFATVLFPLNAYSGFTLNNVTINGNKNTLGTVNYCHAFSFGNSGTFSNWTLNGDTIHDCDYGFFSPSSTPGTITAVTIAGCNFYHNYADDLEFNTPSGVCTNVTVKDCSFRNNAVTTSGGGFALGFANVQTGLVDSNFISGYANEGLHFEDRTASFTVQYNTLQTTGSKYLASVLVVNNAHNITFNSNYIDNRSNTGTGLYAFLVTAGGVGLTSPYNIAINNSIIQDSAGDTNWYYDPGSTTLSGNVYNH